MIGIVYPKNIVPGKRPPVSSDFHERKPLQFRIVRRQKIFSYNGRIRHFQSDGDFLRRGAFQRGRLKLDEAGQFLNNIGSDDVIHVDKECDPASRQNDEEQGNGKNKEFLLDRSFWLAVNFILLLM